MSCDELREDYELYALGLAEEPERSELRGHLNRGCNVCGAGVRQAREMMATMSAAVPDAAPPARLRKRILASVGAARSGWAWMPLWIAVSACCLLVAAFFYGRNQAERARLDQTLALLNAPDTRQVSFAGGKVFVNPQSGVLLLASNLPPAPPGKTYEMWVIPKSGKPAPAGLFQSKSDGTASHLQKGPVDLGATGAVAVTVEAAGGALQPTSQPIIVAAL